MAVVVVAHLVHARSWFLFENGDAFTTVLLTHSLAVGQPQDWAMSPVLFVPETAGYAVLSLLGLSVRATLTLAALGAFVGLYGAMRVAAGSRRTVRRPVAGALTGFGLFCGLAMLDGGADRVGYQLPSMLASTTYYSATVLATVLTVGLVRRAVDAARATAEPGDDATPPAGASPASPRVTPPDGPSAPPDRPSAARGAPPAPSPRRPGLGPATAIALVAALSTFSNPLFAGWATVPVLLVLAVLALRHRVPRRVAVVLGGGLLAGTLAGALARIPMDPWIVAHESNYLRLSDWTASLAHYGDLVAQTTSTPRGAASFALTVVLWLACLPLAWVLRRGTRLGAQPGAAGAAFTTGVAFVAPVLALVAAVASGSFPERYLQPWVFLPAVALTAVPNLLADVTPWPEPGSRLALAARDAVVLLLLLAAGLALPRLVPAPSADADARCVADWVDASGRTGAGQFWTVRAPKAQLGDPRRLVQVDHRLGVYTWLTNRTDRDGARVTFLVDGPRTDPWVLPAGVTTADATRVDCGVYTILDLGDRVLPLGSSSP